MNKIFPKVVDNNYNGKPVALYMFYVFTTIMFIRGIYYLIYSTCASERLLINLNNPNNCKNAIVGLYSLMGFYQIIIGLIFLAVSVYYKSLIPFMYLILLIHFILRFVITKLRKIPFWKNVPLNHFTNISVIFLTFLLFILSITE